MKSFKDILSEKPKKEKKFSIDQINAVLAKVGIKPSMVVAAINALNAARGLGIVEAKSDVDKIHQADMNRFLRNAIDEYNKLMTSMVAINVRDSDIKREWKKVDKAFDKIMEIANKKDYFIS
jgi:hypothetical protein